MLQIAAFMAIIIMLVYFWEIWLAIAGILALIFIISAVSDSVECSGNDASPAPEEAVHVKDFAVFAGGSGIMLGFFIVMTMIWG